MAATSPPIAAPDNPWAAGAECNINFPPVPPTANTAAQHSSCTAVIAAPLQPRWIINQVMTRVSTRQPSLHPLLNHDTPHHTHGMTVGVWASTPTTLSPVRICNGKSKIERSLFEMIQRN